MPVGVSLLLNVLPRAGLAVAAANVMWGPWHHAASNARHLLSETQRHSTSDTKHSTRRLIAHLARTMALRKPARNGLHPTSAEQQPMLHMSCGCAHSVQITGVITTISLT